VPHWAKDLNTRFSMINARAETLHEKPAYRGLVRRAERRCLILADGYYEWQRREDPGQPRRPVRFSLEGDEPFEGRAPEPGRASTPRGRAACTGAGQR
jgi:putative SOS response-associated peptidase YedK